MCVNMSHSLCCVRMSGGIKRGCQKNGSQTFAERSFFSEKHSKRHLKTASPRLSIKDRTSP